MARFRVLVRCASLVFDTQNIIIWIRRNRIALICHFRLEITCAKTAKLLNMESVCITDSTRISVLLQITIQEE